MKACTVVTRPDLHCQSKSEKGRQKDSDREVPVKAVKPESAGRQCQMMLGPDSHLVSSSLVLSSHAPDLQTELCSIYTCIMHECICWFEVGQSLISTGVDVFITVYLHRPT